MKVVRHRLFELIEPKIYTISVDGVSGDWTLIKAGVVISLHDDPASEIDIYYVNTVTVYKHPKTGEIRHRKSSAVTGIESSKWYDKFYGKEFGDGKIPKKAIQCFDKRVNECAYAMGRERLYYIK